MAQRIAFPDDLRDAYTFAKIAAQHFHGKVKAWEVWNEADIPMFSVDPGNEYAAFLKAAYLGFKAGDSNLSVTQTSFALAAGPFGQLLRRNGTADYFDIYNYHIYDDPKNYPDRAKGHFDLRTAAHIAHRPVWLTEAGIPLRATNDTLSLEDQKRQAEFIPKSCVMSLASGTTKHFAFVFPHYLENGVEFGMLDANFRPYPGYAALATLVNALGDADYTGEIRFQQPGLHLHVFDNGQGNTLVAWADTPELKTPLALSPAARRWMATAQILDVVGTPSPLNADVRDGLPRLTLSPSPIYIQMPYTALSGVRVFGTLGVAEILGDAGQGKAKREEALLLEHQKTSRPSALVLRLRLPEAKADKSAEAYSIAAGKPTPVEVQIYNFGNRAFTGNVNLTPPDGWTLNRQQIPIANLSAMGRQVETLTLTPGAGNERKELRGLIQQANGETGSPAVLDIMAQ